MRHLIRAACALPLLLAAAATLAQTSGQDAPPLPQSPRVMLAEVDRTRMNEAIAQALHPISFADGRLSGPGGVWLAERLRDADILMIGESHGTGSVAQAASALIEALPHDRPLAYALEIGPASAAIQEPLLRGPETKHEAFMADPRRAISFAFLNLREEAALARQILGRAHDMEPALWGLDQEFAPSVPLLLDRLEGLARQPAQHEAIAVARAQTTPLMALAKLPESFLDPLETAFADGPASARKLIADMRLSARVYHWQERDPIRSNREREDYMKRNFIAQWRAARAQDPRIVMKFGAYHLTAGFTPTAAPALGGFVEALALMEDKTIASVLIVCGPDGDQIDFRGQVRPCTDDFNATAGLFRRHLFTEGATLIDTAPLRRVHAILRRLGVPEDSRNYFQSYDAIIVLRGAKAATPFAPPPASLFEGM